MGSKAHLSGSTLVVFLFPFAPFCSKDLSDRGHERGCNIRSINDLKFNDGPRGLRFSNGYSGYVGGSRSVDSQQ